METVNSVCGFSEASARKIRPGRPNLQLLSVFGYMSPYLRIYHAKSKFEQSPMIVDVRLNRFHDIKVHSWLNSGLSVSPKYGISENMRFSLRHSLSNVPATVLVDSNEVNSTWLCLAILISPASIGFSTYLRFKWRHSGRDFFRRVFSYHKIGFANFSSYNMLISFLISL